MPMQEAEFIESNNKIKYKVPIRTGSRIHEILGEIKKKNDGRYNWFLIPSTFHKHTWNVEKHKQGVSKTLDEAKTILTSCWIEEI